MPATNLEKFERAERLATEIYRTLAGYSTDKPGALAMFERLEREEIQHALRVHMLMHLCLAQPRELACVSIDEAALDHALAQAAHVLRELRAQAEPIALEGARHLMVNLERRFASMPAEELGEARQSRAGELLLAALADGPRACRAGRGTGAPHRLESRTSG